MALEGLFEENYYAVDIDCSPSLQLAQTGIGVLWSFGVSGNLL